MNFCHIFAIGIFKFELIAIVYRKKLQCWPIQSITPAYNGVNFLKICQDLTIERIENVHKSSPNIHWFTM